MSTLETTVTIEATLPHDGTQPSSRLSKHSQPSPGEIDGESLPNVAKRLHNFSILSKLGSGAMGVVYAAWDEQLGRRVAIKLLRPHLTTHQTRFVREAQGLARLNHPHVVQVYQTGIHEGRLFMVMEFVEGKTLRKWLEHGPHKRDAILRVFKEAGRGLAAAHAANLVHRDFKPDNVMVGDDGRTRVMDFGLVHEDGGDLEELLSSQGGTREQMEVARRRLDSALNLELTQPGALLGTPAYMAPEQHLGRPTDARADQFSFCAALWEALYGTRPFTGESWEELIENVTGHKLIEPKRGSDVPNWLRAVVERGLASDPLERWDTMDELLAALDDDPTRKRRLLIAGGVALGLSLIGVTGYQIRQSNQAEAEAAALAVAAEARELRCTAEGDRVRQLWSADQRERVGEAMLRLDHPLAAGAWEKTQATLDRYADSWAQTRKEVCVEADLDPAREQWATLARACLDDRARDLASRIEVLGSFEEPSQVVRAVGFAGDLASVPDCVDEDLQDFIRIPDPEIMDAVIPVRELVYEAAASYGMSRGEAALRSADAAVEQAKRIGWAPLLADALYWRGRSYFILNDADKGAQDLEEALFLAGEHREPKGVDAAAALAFDLRFLDKEAALRWGRVGELLVVTSDAEGSLAHAKLLSDIGVTYAQSLGEPKRAIAYFERSLEIYGGRLPEGHPNQAKLLNNLAVAYCDAERYADSLELHTRVLELRERTLPAEHPDFGVTHVGIGRVHLGEKRFSLAIEHFERALEVFEVSAEDNRYFITVTLQKLAEALDGDKQQREAEAKLERALALQEEGNYSLRAQAPVRFQLAKVAWPLGERERAVQLARKAREDLGAKAEEERAEIDKWLVEHALAPAEPAPEQPK